MKSAIRTLKSQLRAAGGFTLLELMVVVVLIGIMTALVIPEMKRTYEDAALRSAARKLADAFAAANGQAITVNEPHLVRVDARDGRYVVERARGQQGAPRAADVPGGFGTLEKSISVQIVPAEQAEDEGDREERASAANTILFNTDGTCDKTDVVLRDRHGYRLVLRLNPITSRVRILDTQIR